jgi:hypothetical protein
VIDFFVDIGGFIMAPLYFITSLILSGFHNLFGSVFGDDSGAAWALSIIGLTMVIRAALIPLFVKQIKSSRNMQLIQPKVRELQKKYAHDREKLAQETMALYRETGILSKSLESPNCLASSSSRKPCALPFFDAWSSIRKRARKIGICRRIGRQDANGFVPVSR